MGKLLNLNKAQKEIKDCKNNMIKIMEVLVKYNFVKDSELRNLKIINEFYSRKLTINRDIVIGELKRKYNLSSNRIESIIY